MQHIFFYSLNATFQLFVCACVSFSHSHDWILQTTEYEFVVAVAVIFYFHFILFDVLRGGKGWRLAGQNGENYVQHYVHSTALEPYTLSA